MTVRREGEAILLVGRCPAEDAEALLVLLEDGGADHIDLGGVERLHLAVVQLLIAARLPVTGTPGDGFVARYVLAMLNLLQ